MIARLLCIVLLLLVTVFIQAQQSLKKDTVYFGTYTYGTNNRLANLEPLAAYLSSQGEVVFKARSYAGVQELIQGLLIGEIQLAMMNTAGYLTLQRNHPLKVQPIVNLQMGTSALTNYGGCIIAQRSLGINSLSDLSSTPKPLKFALVTNSSTSGNLVPRLLLNSAGIPMPEKRFEVYYAGTHKKAVEAVLQGKTALAGCGCAEIDTAKTAREFDERAVLVASFNDIPLGPIVGSVSMNRDLLRTITQTLLGVATAAPEVFKQFCGGWTEFKQATAFRVVSDQDYDNFRKLFGTNADLWRMID